jgi:hypothetical protein
MPSGRGHAAAILRRCRPDPPTTPTMPLEELVDLELCWLSEVPELRDIEVPDLGTPAAQDQYRCLVVLPEPSLKGIIDT